MKNDKLFSPPLWWSRFHKLLKDPSISLSHMHNHSESTLTSIKTQITNTDSIYYITPSSPVLKSWQTIFPTCMLQTRRFQSRLKKRHLNGLRTSFILWLNISCSHAGPLAVTVTSDSTRYFAKQKQIKSQTKQKRHSKYQELCNWAEK